MQNQGCKQTREPPATTVLSIGRRAGSSLDLRDLIRRPVRIQSVKISSMCLVAPSCQLNAVERSEFGVVAGQRS